MRWRALQTDPLYSAYQAELNGAHMIRSARVGALVVAGLNTAFIFPDFWAHPDRFNLLLAIRLPWNLVMAGVYWAAGRVNPLAVARLGCLLTGAGMVCVIGAAGGLSGNYWPGIMILFLGMPVLLPLSALEAGGILGVLLVAFAGMPLVTGEALTVRSYLVPVCFAVGAALECVASCALLERLRFADFKQRRELERTRDELRELDQAKSRFTANIHHELRTPLTLTLAPLEGLMAGDFGELSQLQLSYMKTMHVNALRLLKLINNLLDLAKAESQQLALHRRRVDVGRLLEDVATGARPMAERKRVALETEGLRDLPSISVDPEALEKVIVNLIGNALKFTEEGGRIAVRGEPSDDGVQLVVADTGVGLPEDQLERIFDRFAQVDTSATRRYEGTGIGLSLSKELVEAHGGRIWAESAGLGQGAAIHVWLPAGDVDEAEDEAVLEGDDDRTYSAGQAFDALAAEIELPSAQGEPYRNVEMERTAQRYEAAHGEGAPAAAAAAEASLRPEVLVVEDNADMRRLLAFVLEREFRVRVARNGREALEALRESLPALVLTDIMMPEMSGTELCRAVKENPDTRGIPVVLVTSKAEREMKIEGLEMGADDYVTKPFHPRELLARVRSLVRLRQLQEDLVARNAELETALTELKEAEVQLVQAERLAAVGELAAGVAHEVNNPVNFAVNSLRALRAHVEDVRRVAARLAAIDWRDPVKLEAQARELEGMQEELGFEELAGTLDELAGIVTEGLERTHRLVSDLRDFAVPRSASGAPVDVRECLRATVQLLGHALQQAGVAVEMSLGGDVPAVQGDARALNQVFLNLLKNAAETLEGRGGTIRVAVRRAGAAVRVEIEDDGPGIPAEVHERLFEPFFTTKEAGRGTGLGLSISRRIVMEHGGTIDVSSSPGQGTTVAVELPGAESDRAA